MDQKLVVHSPSPDDPLSGFSPEEVGALFADAFGQPAEWPAKTAQVQTEIRRGHHYILASLGGRLHGFVSWQTWFEPRHRLAELVHIGVRQQPKTPGVGQQLVISLESAVHRHFQSLGYPGCRKIILLTHQNNRVAQAFYRRCGFHLEVGQDGRPFIWPELCRENVDEVIMTMDFPEHRL